MKNLHIMKEETVPMDKKIVMLKYYWKVSFIDLAWCIEGHI